MVCRGFANVCFQVGPIGMSCHGNRVHGAPRPGSQAAYLGVQEGWKIVTINGKRVPNDHHAVGRMVAEARAESHMLQVRFNTCPRPIRGGRGKKGGGRRPEAAAGRVIDVADVPRWAITATTCAGDGAELGGAAAAGVSVGGDGGAGRGAGAGGRGGVGEGDGQVVFPIDGGLNGKISLWLGRVTSVVSRGHATHARRARTHAHTHTRTHATQSRPPADPAD